MWQNKQAHWIAQSSMMTVVEFHVRLKFNRLYIKMNTLKGFFDMMLTCLIESGQKLESMELMSLAKVIFLIQYSNKQDKRPALATERGPA